MTEDDTFRILKRKTFKEMKPLIKINGAANVLKTLTDNGWTYDEYFAVLQQQAPETLVSTPRKTKQRVAKSEVGLNVNDFWNKHLILKSTK